MATRKSMRGETVDVDLIKMKHQLEQGTKTESAIKRESYVDNRRRRSSSRRVSEMIANEHMVRQKLSEQKAIKEYEQESKDQSEQQDLSMDNYSETHVEAQVVDQDQSSTKEKTRRIIKK